VSRPVSCGYGHRRARAIPSPCRQRNNAIRAALPSRASTPALRQPFAAPAAGEEGPPLHATRPDVVFTPGRIGGVNQRPHDPCGWPENCSTSAEATRTREVGQAVTAEQGRVRSNGIVDVDEVGIIGLVWFRAGIPYASLPAGGASPRARNLLRILPIRRPVVIAGDFLDAVPAQLVEACLRRGRRSHAPRRQPRRSGRTPCHSTRAAARAMDFVVGDRMMASRRSGDGPRLPFEPRLSSSARYRRLSRRQRTADSVDDQEQAARHVDVEAVSLTSRCGRDRCRLPPSVR
jgi:hypothetical protein